MDNNVYYRWFTSLAFYIKLLAILFSLATLAITGK